MDVINRGALVKRLGYWPDFHDAEIYEVLMDSGQRSDGLPRLQLAIHVFAVRRALPDGKIDWINHTLVRLRFDEVEAVQLDGFGPQNVLEELVLEDLRLTGSAVQVSLVSSNGLDGTFRCRAVTVLSVEPMTPGAHSVYAR